MPAALDDFCRSASVPAYTGLPTLQQFNSPVASRKGGVDARKPKFFDGPTDVPEAISASFKVAEIADGALPVTCPALQPI